MRGMVMAAGCLFTATLGVGLVAQGGPPQSPPAPPQGAAPQQPPPAQGGGGQQNFRLTFPAAQRPPGDPALIARGKSLYEINCRLCHGADLRGGDMGGVSLVRSELVLNDQKGELIYPVVQQGRSRPGMPTMPRLGLAEADVAAVAEYIHSVLASSGRGGGPAPALNLLVGNAAAGQTYFSRNCAACHSATGDLAGIGGRITDVMTLQNTWVAGMRIAGGRDAPVAKRSIATVTPRSGGSVTGELIRMDDFVIAVKLPDGTERSFRREGEMPAVDIKDPRAPHIKLWTTLVDKDMHDVTAYLASLK